MLTKNHKSILDRRMKSSRHGDYENGDNAKTGDKLSMHCVSSRKNEF